MSRLNDKIIKIQITSEGKIKYNLSQMSHCHM